ncbi:transcription initiation factor TFIIIB [Bacillus sp. Bva_UNVM-123]|uniref:transcription initiation factor TFIIIB n=1 Tax=Bacillus sp. Bva_UNVM-123 TaxID=2829798 RepID=UPI00391F5996
MVNSIKIKECSKCGGTELGKGLLNGYANMIPKGKILGSSIESIICTDCGYIIESYVTKPSRFKDTIY